MLDTRKKMGYTGLLALNFMSMFLIACMGVVGYAMAGEFDAVSQVGLVFALETCFRCTVCPISGKLGEKLGRKPLLIGALIVYTAAYAVSAFATNFTVILVTRCLAGAAWACWMVNSFLLFCDLFGQSEGPKYSGIAQTVGTVSILIAAPVAGLICKYDWRITFYVSVPALVLITLLCAVGPPRSEKSAGGGRMDVAGSLFCALMLVPFCLAMSLGSLKGWTSPLMLVFSALMNSSGGMVTMFRFPIAMFVVMAVFGIFLFRDIKSGETL